MTSRVELISRYSTTNFEMLNDVNVVDKLIEEMIADGVQIEGDVLYTFDLDIAKKYGMMDEREWFDPK